AVSTATEIHDSWLVTVEVVENPLQAGHQVVWVPNPTAVGYANRMNQRIIRNAKRSSGSLRCNRCTMSVAIMLSNRIVGEFMKAAPGRIRLAPLASLNST